jgi:excinuclease ABC subunit C
VTSLRDRAATAPRRPGVYLWKDSSGNVLYVGKAQDLRARVLQYFGRQEEERRAELMQRAADVELLVVGSNKEALLLEQTLIKRHLPPYNVLLRDDKRYPYIAITDETWPRVVYTRNLDLKGSLFGPFPDAWKAKRVARMLNQTFRLRQCRTLPKRECLYFHLNQCTAPCIGAVGPEAYREQVQAAQAFLKGRGSELRYRLRAERDRAAAELRFERAAELRDLEAAVGSVLERQRVDDVGGDDQDAVGLAQRDGRWCAVILWVRGGAVVGREHHFLTGPQATPSPDVLAAFLEQAYVAAPQMPREVLLPVPLDRADALARLLGDVHGHPVRLHVPERGTRRRFVDLAEENARMLLEQDFLLRERRGPEALEQLRQALRLPDVPSRIECFDVSHHAGEHTVASLVVLQDGRPLKSAYRRFRIRTAAGGDDPAAIREAVSRRYARLLSEEGADALPDLVVVDGGRTQLEAALEALAALGLEAIPLFSLAKKREEVYKPRVLHPLRLDPASPALHLLMRARDEAHRFAIGYQGVLKRRAFIQSELDGIPGVGAERRRRLLATFGSVEGLRQATPDQIAQVPGIPRPLAQRIYEALRAPPPEPTGG